MPYHLTISLEKFLGVNCWPEVLYIYDFEILWIFFLKTVSIFQLLL